MTRTADVPARNTVYQILCEAILPGLELRPKTLRSGAALLYERIYESLFPLQKVKELQRRRIALDTTITLCAEHAGARHREPDFTPHARHFRLSRARAPFTSPARVWGVRLCTDLGLPPPALEGHSHMTNRRRTGKTGFPDIRGQGRAVRKQGHSALPRLPTDVQQEPREHDQRPLQSALAATRRRPDDGFAQHCHQLWRHPGSDYHRSVTPPCVYPAPVARLRQQGNGYRSNRPCSGLRRVPRRSRPGR